MKISNFARATLIAVFSSLSVLAISTSTKAASLTPVDLELSLLVDVSGSVDSGEFNLQQQGYVNAFSNPNLYTDLISQGALGKIAVNLIYWSGANEQQQAVGWTLIDSVASSNAFASAIAAAARPFSGSTAPGSAINYATPLLFNNSYDGTRQVIDVSGDGASNDGAITATARDAALAAGVDTINGLVIGDEFGLQDFYQNNVIGGSNSAGNPAFVLAASTFQEFSNTIDNKLKKEINPTSVPEPASLIGLLGLGAFGVASKLKRSQKQLANV